jgi:hypothetical protein
LERDEKRFQFKEKVEKTIKAIQIVAAMKGKKSGLVESVVPAENNAASQNTGATERNAVTENTAAAEKNATAESVTAE